MKEFFNKIPFEYVLSGFILPTALIFLHFHSFASIVPMIMISVFMAWKLDLCKGIICAAAAILLALCGILHDSRSPDNLKNILNERSVYGRIRFIINDPVFCSLQDIPNGATAKVNIINIETAAGENFSGNGDFLLYARDILPENCVFGDIFEIQGTLRFATPRHAWDVNKNTMTADYRFGDFQDYMRLHGIDGLISPDRECKAIKISEQKSLARTLLLFRDRTLQYIIKNLQHSENKNLIAAMFFGLKGALEPASKQDFIKSGTIHLFSVSGLHIGILFAILLPLLNFLPVRSKYLCASLLLIPFLLSTGANIPAIRAFLMILGFSVLRYFFFYVPPLRILALGCSVFLIWNADHLQDIGFLYSFGITGILLLLSENISKWNRIWNTDNSFKAVNRKNPNNFFIKNNILQKMCFALIGTLAAFAAGSIITLHSFGHLYLSAVWINFFILFYCTVLIYLFILKIIITPVAFIGTYYGVFFDKCLDFMQQVIDFGAAYPCRIDTVQISPAAAVLFYFALITVFAVRNRKIFITSAIFLIMFFPSAALLSDLQKPELLIIKDPSSSQCAFVLAHPVGNYSWCFNIQNTQSAELARKFLSSKGINHVNIYLQYGNTVSKNSAMKNMIKNVNVKKVLHFSRTPLKDIPIPKGTIYELRRRSPSNWQYFRGISSFFRKKNEIGFEYYDPEAILPLCVNFNEKTQTLTFSENGSQRTHNWHNSNLLEYYTYEL